MSKWTFPCLLLLSAAILVTLVNNASAQTPTEQNSRAWPHPIPCRIQDGANKDLFILTLGDVQTPLADGTFYPEQDLVRLKDGTEIASYYQDSLGIKYFMPIDKSVFPLPPSGWCSWYYYYQEISAEEVKKNAEWLGKHLKPFGARYCQIDDGWQGTGHGLGENRDWTTIDKRFPQGMAELASYIKKQGLEPGLWLAPHGQSNAAVVRESKAFLLKPNGESASSTWEGTYLVDPSSREGHAHLRNLFTILRGWGYSYFKIDGQPIVIHEYEKTKDFMKKPSDDAEAIYRGTLETIRKAIGPETYLLGCWGIPLLGVGIMNGSRTGGDIVCDWKGFFVALDAVMKWNFLHNVAWYCDPDVMLLRPPLTLDMARAWATLQGLTGQALLASDRMMDLSAERVEILKRMFPAVDIRPLDLFPSNARKRIWDLKVNHLNRDYDVVGVFNYDEEATSCIHLKWADLGLPDDGLVHVFDFWAKEYLGCWEKGFFVEVPPAAVRVLTLLPAEERPLLISTSRHITQGWGDLKSLKYDAATLTYTGKSALVGSDPYELRFAFPRSGTTYRIKSAKVEGLDAGIENHQGWSTCAFTSPTSKEVNWEVTFEPTDYYSYPVQNPSNLTVKQKGFHGVEVSWRPNYALNCGYLVYLNNELLGYAPTPYVQLSDLDLDGPNELAVATVWWDGTTSPERKTVDLNNTVRFPDEVFLSDIEPSSSTIGWGSVQINLSVHGGTISIGGKVYKKGIGTHAVSDIVYPAWGKYSRFSAEVGVDDEVGAGRGSVEFVVYGDDKPIWSSGVMKGGDPPKRIDVDITGVKLLRLHVGDAGDNINYDHTDWAEAKISK